MLAKPGAIAILLFSLAGACGPDLSRSAGRVELEVTVIPDAADRLRFELENDGSTRYAREQSVGGDRVEHVIETVPAGPATVEILGFEAERSIARARLRLVVEADRVNRVSVPLEVGLGGADRILSSPLEGRIGPLRDGDVVGGRLEGCVDLPAPVFPSASSPPVRLRLASARLQLDLAGGDDADELDEAWPGSVELLIGAGRAPAATAIVEDDATAVDFGAIAAIDVDPGPISACVSGAARPDPTDDFEVTALLTLVLSAELED